MAFICASHLPVALAGKQSVARGPQQARSGLSLRPAHPTIGMRPVAARAVQREQNDNALSAPALAMLAASAAWLSGPDAVQAATEAAGAAASSDPSLQAMGMEILVYFAKTLISWGIPGAISIVVVLLATARSKGPRKSDDDEDQAPAFLKQFMKQGKGGIEPKEFLKVTPLNERLESYSYSLTKATDNKARAAVERRRQLYKKNFGDFVGDLSDEAVEAVLKAEKAWRKDVTKAQEAVNMATRALHAESVASAPSSDSKDSEKGGIGGMMKGGSNKKKDLEKELSRAVTARTSADNKYIQAVAKVLTKSQREQFAKILEKKSSPGWQDSEDPIALAPVEAHADKPNRVFVLKFNGDVQASQVKNLREEVTAVIRNASKESGDEVLLVLNTGGGTVTGYGLAAAQLIRIKEAGLKLTICVEQVAASGGYMMACCADRIVASPFAVLGSIGVISEQPNLYDRLKREGIEFQTVTAGKYKRTLTPFKKPTEEDFAKSKEDIEQVFLLFKDFVNSQRPSVNIDEVATGETWFGPDALAKGLVDELKTVDDILLEKLEAGSDIYTVAFAPTTNPIQQLVGSPAGSGAYGAMGGLFAPLGLMLENAMASAMARQLEKQQQIGAQDSIRAMDPNKTADSIKAADSSSDMWFM